jgi:hypothetical protein
MALPNGFVINDLVVGVLRLFPFSPLVSVSQSLWPEQGGRDSSAKTDINNWDTETNGNDNGKQTELRTP